MPGFFESLGRMVKGEPVFQPGDDGSRQQESAPAPAAAPVVQPSHRTDGKTVPTVTIVRTECDIDDVYMTISAEVKNQSNEPVYVDKVMILGMKRELDRDMNPGEEHEFLIYQGPRPTGTHQTRAELHYRNKAGDYFASIHFVEFRQLQDGMFVVDEVRFIPPIKDV